MMEFLRKAAFEYLITGLIVPEIKLSRIPKRQLRTKHIQRIDSLLYPTELWVRNSSDIEIKKPFISSGESYFLLIPDEVQFFVMNDGTYPDGTKDPDLWNDIKRLYGDFVSKIKSGETKILLENPLIVKALTLADSQYPIPYLFDVLESLKHKRNMRRMDYSLAARVITAILHVTAGSDEYPLTEDQEEFLTDLENKLKWRETISGDDIERVFTLFTNHTVKFTWVFPEIDALLSDTKYDAVNKDILTGLGFPRILVTGETERSFTSDPEIATLSPLNTLRVMREKLLPIVKTVYTEMQARNRVITALPEIKFKPINLMSLKVFYEGLAELYASGNLSRQSYAEAYGYDLQSELQKREEEQEVIEEMGLQEFAPVPHSNEPGQTGKTTGNGQK
jgi:hypothetical protein